MLSISRPVLHIFPNLTHLTWTKDPARPASSLKLSLLFLMPGLKSLSVQTGHDSSDGDLFAIDNFFHEVVLRSPHLEHVDFRSEIPFHDMGPALPRFLTSFPKLKSVLLSDALLCSDVVTALAACPSLEIIRIPPLSETSGVKKDLNDLENFMPVVEEGQFQAIREIHFKANLWNAARFLRSAFPAWRLRQLLVKTLRLETTSSIGGFFSVVAAVCPSIEVLTLWVDNAITRNFGPISFSSIEPLLACRSLKSFSFEAPSLLDLDDTQAAAMGLNWPRLEKLHLNPLSFPQPGESIRMTLAGLNVFAKHCQELKYLAVCIQVSPSDIPPLKACGSFSKLETLVMGVRNANYDVEKVALYLTDITPSNCTLASTPLFSMLPVLDRVLHNLICQSQIKLEKVLVLVPVLRKIQTQYRGKLESLEEELQRLTSVVQTELKP